MRSATLFLIVIVVCSIACQPQKEKKTEQAPYRLMTLDPGHFHAALVQKQTLPNVDDNVFIFAPEGPDVQDHLNRIRGFNTRKDNPTSWNEEVYTGPDFLDKMIEAKPGNIVVISGNNARKAEYIYKSVAAGLNVLADKPMVIASKDFDLLVQAFEMAKKNNVLLYDIMTERYEITTVLQKALSQNKDIFGTLEKGSIDNPAVTKESVHHFFKYVAGNPIKRPAWFFDVTQQGEGIVDVTTHLVDLIQWECFPNEVLDYNSDIDVLKASHWSTELTPAMFRRVTHLDNYPDYLKKAIIKDSVLNVFSNGAIDYTLKGVHAHVSVIWNYEAPTGAKDTHYSIMRGTGANLIIKQGKEENYKPELYIENNLGDGKEAFLSRLQKAIETLQASYPGIKINDDGEKVSLVIPDKYKLGHEAHFTQVTEKYLQYLDEGNMPAWEVPNMIAKYYTTTKAYELSR